VKVLKQHFLSIMMICIGGGISVMAEASTPSSPPPSSSTQPTTFTSISSNPAAVNSVTGTSAAQQYIENLLGIKNDHGIRIGGAWIADTNDLFAGGIPNAQQWTSNSSLLLGMLVDTQKLFGLPGGTFGAEFLQFNGQPTNEQAGTVQGYNSLPGPPPLNRSELYQLWYQQRLFNNKLIIKVGKTIPTYDFDNVVKPVALSNNNLNIPAVSGLIYTPLFVNPTTLDVIPGFYNSAYGVTVSYLPTKQWYFSFGAYDGNLANGTQTGMKVGPTFNGNYFYIGETGVSWLLGKQNKPGNIGIGAWEQSGPITSSPTIAEDHAAGFYIFGNQRLWYKDPFQNRSGISAFYQYGSNNSQALPVNRYVGGGLTAFGLVHNRLDDSIGIGASLSWLNQNTYVRSTELMYQAYYQAKIMTGIYLEPVLSYIPTPGASANLPPAWAGTLRLIVLF
jgi:porin